MNTQTLGVVIAGGVSSRFGSAKALALVGGRRMVDRITDAMRSALDHDRIVCIANDAALATQIGLVARPDRITDVGAIAGLHAALQWADELGCAGILAVGCDMPFVSSALLRELLELAVSADAVLPASTGPRGVEPLYAWYGSACLSAIEAALERGDRRMIGFHAAVRVTILPLERVRVHGEPEILFMNLNTPADRALAERLAAGTRP